MKFACILINEKLVVKFRYDTSTMGPECIIYIGGVCHSTIQNAIIASHLFSERIMSCTALYGEIIWLTKYINVQYALHKFPMLSIIAKDFVIVIVVHLRLILHRIVVPQTHDLIIVLMHYWKKEYKTFHFTMMLAVCMTFWP